MATSATSTANFERDIPSTENSSVCNSSSLMNVNIAENSNNYEIVRIISFPDSMSWNKILPLAKLGFHYLEDNVICYFCGHRVDILSGTDDGQHECSDRRENNLPHLTDNTDYRYEANRIISFLKAGWCKKAGSLPVGSLDLACWGFYCTGESDAARCNFCRLEVRGWESGDTAYNEHKKWNPHCPFISGRQCGNVKLGEEASTFELSSNCASLSRINNGDNSNIEARRVLQLKKVKHPEYSNLPSRLSSFSTWPLSLHQRPNDLSQAGFYYTGKGDRVICYQCGGGLKDWGLNDNPWIEHAVWFPHCDFLKAQKGSDFILKVQHLKNQQQSCSATQNVIQVDTVQNLKHDIGIQILIEQTIPEFRQCKVCLDKELNIVFLPCGHLASCIDCAPQLSCCPLCTTKISAFVRAFFSTFVAEEQSERMDRNVEDGATAMTEQEVTDTLHVHNNHSFEGENTYYSTSGLQLTFSTLEAWRCGMGTNDSSR